VSSPLPGQQQLLDITLGETNETVRRILEAIPGGLCVVTPDGSVRAANQAACHILGLSYDELTHRYTEDFGRQTVWEDGSPCPPEDYPVSKVLTTGAPQPARTLGVRRPDGQVSWAVFRAVDLRDPQTGALTGALVTFLDVTERKRAEQELQEKQAWLRQAQHLARIGSFIWDRASGAVEWSDEMHVIYGTDPARFEPTWEAALELIHEEDRGLVQRNAATVWSTGQTQHLEFRIAHRDGTIRHLWGEGQARLDERGVPTRMVGVVQDITQRVLDEAKRRELEEQLRHSQRMDSVGQLAGGVAHDFNNLIQVILGNTDLSLAANTSEAQRRESLGEIRRSAERAADLTRQMLAFSRRQEMRPSDVDLNTLIAGLVKMLRRLISERIELTFLPESPLGAVHADPSQIEQVLLNLCVNARDAMPQGGHITISTRGEASERGRQVLIRVSDTGRGIPEHVAPRVFEPFFTTKAPGQGTGLGLSVVYGIVKQHGGTVDFCARPEGGTTFEVRLPQSAKAAARIPTPEAFHVAGGTETVLVVEDEEMVRRLTIRVLEDAGYKVLSAENGRAALSVIAETNEPIALVLLDLVMPEIGGEQLYEQLRVELPELRFLFTSGYPLNRNMDELVQGGVPALMKPYGADALLKKVREILSASG
jgi:two-component system, cell cycle sensor histidine kinase and response regulator CckA